MIYNFSETNSLMSQYLSELRDITIQGDRLRFRTNLERMGLLMSYEISKTMTYKKSKVETPLGESEAFVLSDDIVIASILRAGLPLHNGFLSAFDRAENAFISAYRQHHKDGTFEIRMEYITCPNIEDKVLFILDPMLATGASLDATVRALLEYGKPKEIHIATIIASSQGVDHVRRLYPKAHLWVGAIDEELTAKSYIVPGLGDAGDLAFGAKMQE